MANDECELQCLVEKFSFFFHCVSFLFYFIIFSRFVLLLVIVVSPRDSLIVLFIVSIICSYSVFTVYLYFFVLYLFFYFVVEFVPSLFVVYLYSCCTRVWVAAFGLYCSCDGIVVSVIFPFYSKCAEFIYLNVFYYAILCWWDQYVVCYKFLHCVFFSVLSCPCSYVGCVLGGYIPAPLSFNFALFSHCLTHFVWCFPVLLYVILR